MAFDWQKACRDCRNVWGLEYEADGNTVANKTDCECPECGSDAIESLAQAQQRAELAADLPSYIADCRRVQMKDDGAL